MSGSAHSIAIHRLGRNFWAVHVLPLRSATRGFTRVVDHHGAALEYARQLGLEHGWPIEPQERA